MTLLLAWTQQDAAKYLETLKVLEFKPPDVLKEQITSSQFARLTNCLTQIKSVNKTDVVTLTSNFHSFNDIIHASKDQLASLPGFGDHKVARLQQAFDEPFLLLK